MPAVQSEYATNEFVGAIAVVASSAVALAAAAVSIGSISRPFHAPSEHGGALALAPGWVSEVSFRGITVSTQPIGSNAPRTLLCDLHGELRRGELVALMGPSGSGKSTLIKLLAGESNGPLLASHGVVHINGRVAGALARRRMFGYLAQADYLPAFLTTSEAVSFSARLRLPGGTAATAADAAAAALNQLGLGRVLTSRISSLSGGEQRRTAIAMELVTSPAIILLDEPLSGLDSANALALVSTLSTLASQGRAIMAVVHAPSTEAFSMFDRAVLLADGRQLWEGPALRDGGVALTAFFREVGRPCPSGRTLVEHLLFVAIPDSGGHSIKPLSSEPLLVASHSNMAAAPADEVAAGALSPPPAAPLTLQLRALLWRELVRVRRQPSLLVMHVALALFIGIFMGVVFFNLGASRDIKGFQQRLGLVFFDLTFFAFAALSAAQTMFTDARLQAHEAHRAYSPGLATAVKLGVDFALLRALPAVLNVCCLYWMAGLQPAVDRFLIFLAGIVLNAVGTASMVMWVGAASPSAAVTTLVASFFLLMMMVFGGLLTSTRQLSPFLAWLRFTSFSFLGFEALVSNEFRGLRFELGLANIRGIQFTGAELGASGLALELTHVHADLLLMLAWLASNAAFAVFLAALWHRPRGL